MRAMTDFAQRLNGLSRRERLLLLGSLVAILLLLWNYLLLVPLETRHASAVEQRQILQGRIASLETEQSALIRRLAADPSRQARERIASLDRQLAEQEVQINRRMQRFMRPSEMAGLLRNLLEADSGLSLQRLETLPPEVVVKGHSDAEPPLVFRHGLLLEFNGGYAETLRYLQRVERVAGMLGWDRLELVVEQHPRSRVRIRVHTLSTRREAIGV